MKYLLSVLLLLACAMPALAADSVAGRDLDADQAQRYHQMTKELRCLVCQNESIAESDADLAADLRHLVARKIADGESDSRIKSYLVDRYGDWVLYDPPLQWSTWLLWTSPFVLLLLALVGGMAILRGSRPNRSKPQQTLDDERLAQLLDDTDKHTRQDRSRSK